MSYVVHGIFTHPEQTPYLRAAQISGLLCVSAWTCESIASHSVRSSTFLLRTGPNSPFAPPLARTTTAAYSVAKAGHALVNFCQSAPFPSPQVFASQAVHCTF